MNSLARAARLFLFASLSLGATACVVRRDGGFDKPNAVGQLPASLGEILGGAQIVHVREVTVAPDLAATLRRQAESKGVPAAEVDEFLRVVSDQVSRRVYSLATKDRAFIVFDNKSEAAEKADLRFDVVVNKLDIVGATDGFFGDYAMRVLVDQQAKGASFECEVELVAVRRGVNLAASTGGGRKNHVLTEEQRFQYVRTLQDASSETSTAKRSTQLDMILSPIKDALDSAVERAWGSMWREYVSSVGQSSPSASTSTMR
ncbi:MAG: hypothetical protein L6Q99_02200 [Planctomycetes bacterium]|nr:hypothetical protein [Planctomycetota bacterium]